MSDLIENTDFYYDESGNMVFTSKYHEKRGFCCKSGCRHCPFGFGKDIDPTIPTEFLTHKEDQEEDRIQALLEQYSDDL